MTSTTDLLAALGTHLTEFELPAIASVHLATFLPEPEVTVQLSGCAPAAIAAGSWRGLTPSPRSPPKPGGFPRGDSVHLSVSGLLPGGVMVRVYGALRVPDLLLSAGLEPDATTTVTLATLRHLATPGRAVEEVTP